MEAIAPEELIEAMTRRGPLLFLSPRYPHSFPLLGQEELSCSSAAQSRLCAGPLAYVPGSILAFQ
jgi:hypothetical protein